MSKKRFVFLLLIVFLFILVPMTSVNVNASAATSYTMTIDAKRRYVRTQDAYLPDKTVIDLALSKPLDLMFDENDHLYIADTGNRKILKYDPATNQVLMTITHPDMKSPKGLFVSSRGVYVADSIEQTVFRFDLLGNFVERFDRPISPSFGNTPYNPSKVAVDNRGNLYIYGEGVKDGIIHLSNIGEFLGYFTSNKVELSFTQMLYKVIFTEEQFEKVSSRDPSTFSSVFIDKNSMVYTTTMGTRLNAVKKHNTQGGNIFQGRIFSNEDARDIYVDQQGIIYAAMQNGTIFVYSPNGEFIFNFGSNNASLSAANLQDISGLFKSLAAIAVNSQGDIWSIDDTKSFLQSFKPTEYSEKIYEALILFEDRQYEQAVEVWQDVLRLNQMSVIAHNNIGMNYLQQQQYEEAMYHFELAGNRASYSEAFWEVRNAQIQSSLGSFLVGLVLISLAVWVLKLVDRRTHAITTVMGPVRKLANYKPVNDVLFIFKVFKRPINSFYDLKKGYKGSVLSATIILLIFFILFMNSSINKGFIYQFVAVEDMDINSLVLGFFSIIGLLVVCNYLDTSINDGEGGLKQIYIMFVYSLGPLIVATVLTTILSYYLTYSEVFFLGFILSAGYIWTFINLFLGIGEVHNYTIKKTIKSILMTLLFVVIVAVILMIIIMMWEQLYQFLEALVKEAYRNVTS